MGRLLPRNTPEATSTRRFPLLIRAPLDILADPVSWRAVRVARLSGVMHLPCVMRSRGRYRGAASQRCGPLAFRLDGHPWPWTSLRAIRSLPIWQHPLVDRSASEQAHVTSCLSLWTCAIRWGIGMPIAVWARHAEHSASHDRAAERGVNCNLTNGKFG